MEWIMSGRFGVKFAVAAVLAAFFTTGGAALASLSSTSSTAASAPAFLIQGKLLPDPCAWDAMPAPPSLELTAFRPSTPSSEKGIACPIERHS
jgi:hypothetical protein